MASDPRPSAPPAPRPGEAGAYFNRELSWLAFNERVLDEARNENHPLLERLRFLSISGSNLDEFMMIRVAGLVGQMNRGIERPSIDGLTPQQQLVAIAERMGALTHRQQDTWRALQALLARADIHIADEKRISAEAFESLRAYFAAEIMPLMTPQAIDPAHPFPFVANKGTGLLFSVIRDEDGEELTEMVLLPNALPRFVRVPGAEAIWISMPRLVERFASVLFPGYSITGSGIFRVLRDSDIEIEEEAEDLVRTFRSAIQRRRRGHVIQLELEEDFDPAAEQLLLDELGVDAAAVIRTNGMIGIEGLADIVAEDRPDLKFDSYTPRYPERVLEYDGNVLEAIRQKDIIIHHPYESFEVVVDFIRQAAEDPNVVAIKQTLYRAGNQSAVIAALIAAAEAGKSVTAVVELKARFDEEQNLKWASELERAGVQVVYGFLRWKTHAKVALVVRREDDGFRTYCHFGTGNYHPVTARIYTDLSYFTNDPRLARDAAKMFNFVTGYIEPRDTECLSIAPLNLRERLEEAVEQEIDNARAGRPSGIWIKCNQLTDQGMVDLLYRASEDGVPVDIVCRGMCTLRPQVPGLSDNIRVKSIIGRFLEHSRIYAFANGARLPSPQASVFISSADLMERNLNRRVETLIPMNNRTVHDQVLQQVLLANMLDTEQSWYCQPDGTYVRATARPGSEDRVFNCHRYFMTNPSLSGRGGALEEGGVPKLSLRRGAL
ncbi:RNA degradosome polyphosphate kinase [Erythrobacteraceae bacterium CFH 75059]|uniref:RNA degradosome polyphosphate kinase n=1 Tax=Qipengyuania thermophila TaxID=2509361 RepID=UPI00101F8C9A|nr:RNA degradosome polyphosphate kinase [Qipengyuania thermophila]TCD01881.1 RNA degradosome polyphosphate kinase [Erythrobacteraceae bacterium CFH 75059]